VRDLTQIFEEARPFPGGVRDDWDAVLRDARRRVRRGPAGALVLAILAAAALALFWPFGNGHSGGILDRALAAAGDGPVVHLVVREGWGGTLVDLESGARTPVYAEHEFWYDPARGLHEVSRYGGAVQADLLYRRGEVPRHEEKQLALIGRDYRDALRSGTAENLGPGTAYGEPVYWLRVDAQELEDSDGTTHEWAHDVAISRSTYRPVGTRETRDGVSGPGTGARILRLETLDAGAGDFTVDPSEDPDRVVGQEGQDPIALEDARPALGRTPLWLGRDYDGLPLWQVLKSFQTEGRRPTTQLTGKAAEDALACRDQQRAHGARVGAACDRMAALGKSIFMRGDHVYALGTPVWAPPQTGVVFAYRGDRGEHVELTETTHPEMVRAIGGYAPPDEKALVNGDGRQLLLFRDGVYVRVEASSPELALTAARSLEPMP
jgi:hypothetical protein